MISVILATYNGEKYIKEQLESIIKQSINPDEIVIVDDCSKDLTKNIIKQISVETKIPIYFHENEKNQGSNKTFERALQLSKGEIIFFADQDDYWLPNKIEVFINAFNQNKKAMLVFSNGLLVNESLESLETTNWEKYKIDNNVLNRLKKEKAFITLSDKNYITGASMAIKRAVMGIALPFPEALWHDHWLAIVSSLTGNIVSISDNLFYYRQHNEQQVGIKSKVKRNRFSSKYLKEFFKQERRIIRVIEKVSWYELLKSNLSKKNLETMKYRALLDSFGKFQTKRLAAYKVNRPRRFTLLAKMLLNKQYLTWCRRPYEDFFYDIILTRTD